MRASHLQQTGCWSGETYLCFLLIEVVDDDADEEVQGKEGAKDDEDDKVKVHVDIDFIHWLGFHLHKYMGTITHMHTHMYGHTHKCAWTRMDRHVHRHTQGHTDTQTHTPNCFVNIKI